MFRFYICTVEQSCLTCHHFKWGKPKTQIPSKLCQKIGYGQTSLHIKQFLYCCPLISLWKYFGYKANMILLLIILIKKCTRFAIRRFRWSNGISSSRSFLESSSFRTAIPVSTSSRYFWKISLSVSLYKLIALSYSSMTRSWSPTKKWFYVSFGITYF